MDLNDRQYLPVPDTLLKGLGAKGGWSDAVCAGPFVWVAGQPGWDKKTGILPETFEEQAEGAFENVREALERAGATMDDVVSLRVFLEHAEDYDRYQPVYNRHFPGDQPVRMTVVTGGHVYPNILIDVDAMAVKRTYGE